jgi:hypothetical protein
MIHLRQSTVPFVTENKLSLSQEEAPYHRSNIAKFANIADRNLRNFTIFSQIPASASIAERANIAENAWRLNLFSTNYFKCVMNDVI